MQKQWRRLKINTPRSPQPLLRWRIKFTPQTAPATIFENRYAGKKEVTLYCSTAVHRNQITSRRGIFHFTFVTEHIPYSPDLYFRFSLRFRIQPKYRQKPPHIYHRPTIVTFANAMAHRNRFVALFLQTLHLTFNRPHIFSKLCISQSLSITCGEKKRIHFV